MQDKPKHLTSVTAGDPVPRRELASANALLPGDDLGILLAAGENDGLVVLSGKPITLLAKKLLERAPAPSMRYAYVLTEEGWKALRAARDSQDER
jgi:hypothetical protein